MLLLCFDLQDEVVKMVKLFILDAEKFVSFEVDIGLDLFPFGFNQVVEVLEGVVEEGGEFIEHELGVVDFL